MPLKVEKCTLCEDPTGRAGRGEDSIYVASGTPAEVGPLCECCFNTLTNADVLADLRGFAMQVIYAIPFGVSGQWIDITAKCAKLIDKDGNPTSILTGDE